ncbi:MAG: ABC transporter ATP-binding protein, partial [Defluviitaleaceae bacterium]|nr:ABC transporter ATP-binding protein [Defluviitaleaceae bacterium]
MNRAERMSEYTKKKNRRTVLRLLKYFNINKPITAISLLLVLLMNVAAIIQPLIMGSIVDSLSYSGGYGYDYVAGADFNYILFALIWLGLVVFVQLSGYAQALSLRYLGQQVIHKIRTSLFGHVQTMNMRFFDNNSSGSILTRVTSDVETLSDLYSNIFIMFIREIAMVAMTITAMFILDPRLAWASLASVPVVAALTVFYRALARKNFIKLKALLSRINGFLAEHVIGMKIVQIFNMENKKMDEFDEMNQRYYKLGLLEVILNGLSGPVVNLIANLMTALLIFWFANSVLDVSDPLTLG